MQNLKKNFTALIVGLWALVSVLAVASTDSGGSSTAISGVLGLRTTEVQSCVAIWVPIPEGKALSGFSWYNNDGAVVFPEILLESGTPDNPVNVTDAQLVAENVQGVSSDWSEVELTEPVACLSEGLYLLLRFPAASEYTSDGAGGGPALGYQTDGKGYPGWISADGQEWVALQGDLGFALQPQFVSASDATMFMKGAQREPQDQVADNKKTMLFRATPNPFNPSTKLRFNLAQSGRVDLAVYSLRGELVKRLVSDMLSAGPHEVVWSGRDNSGRSVASGVYFARMQAGKVVMTQRLVLVQ